MVHDKTDHATHYTKCWLNSLLNILKCYTNAFVSADAQIAEQRSQTAAHLKGECFPNFIKECTGQSETHSKRTQRYKKSNFTMHTESSVIPLVCYLTDIYKWRGGGRGKRRCSEVQTLSIFDRKSNPFLCLLHRKWYLFHSHTAFGTSFIHISLLTTP